MKLSRPLVVVLVLIAAYGVYFSALSIQRHRAFQTHASDLGQIDQAIWNTLHGHLLETTRRDGTQLPRLADHVEPVFVLAALVFLLYDGVEALLVLQSFAIAVGGLAVFWIARNTIGRIGEDSPPWRSDWLAVGFALLYLLLPALEAANLAEFHAVALAPAPLLFAYHYGLEKRWGRFALFALLALMTQEVIALLVGTLAAYFFLVELWNRLKVDEGQSARGQKTGAVRRLESVVRRAQVPLAVGLVAAIWFGLTVFILIPHFSPRGASPYACRYIVSEDCPPVAQGPDLPARLGYAGGLLASVGFLALLEPLGLILGLPLLLLNVISNYPAQYSGAYHYSAPVAPYFVLAAIGGAARLMHHRTNGAQTPKRTSIFARSSQWPVALLGAAFFIALGYHLLAGYTPLGGAFVWPQVGPHQQLLERFARQVPPGAVLATTATLHAHLSHRRYLYRYPIVKNAGYVLLDVSESVRANPIDFRVAYNGLLETGYGIQDASDGYILLHRGPGKLANLPDAFYTFFRAAGSPQISGTVEFGDAVRLVGYDVLNDPYGRISLRLYWQARQPLDQNLNLIPLFLDERGEPRTDLDIPPLTVLFWYPSAAWRAGETIVAETLPLDVGPHARLGVGVVLGESWDDPSERLPARVTAPATWQTRGSGTWAEIGAVERTRGLYRRAE